MEVVEGRPSDRDTPAPVTIRIVVIPCVAEIARRRCQAPVCIYRGLVLHDTVNPFLPFSNYFLTIFLRGSNLAMLRLVMCVVSLIAIGCQVGELEVVL